MVRAKTSKKSLVEQLAVEKSSGLYSRAQETQDNITKQLCQQCLDEGIVSPRNLEKILFSVAVIENVGHDSSSARDKC